jgi:hypothetical protein
MTKAHILAEIKRTTKENGGAPLGWRKFRTETGIKEADWLGIHWARWSDALRECGLAPNKLTEGYSDEELIARYVELASELGRLPAHSDMRMKTRKTPGFPTEKTYRRFGGKTKIAALVRAHCATAGPAVVLQLCDEYLALHGNHDDDTDDEAAEVEIGFVYLIRSGRFYKIGRSNAVGRRERELAIQLPERATTVHTIRTDDPLGIEAYWHGRFSARRKNGEWFDLTAQDIAAFRRRKFM